MNYELVISDVEGCVIPADRSPWDHQGLALLEQYNRQARVGRFPALTLCTGRPAQFVDAVGQAIGLFVPAICENGAVLYDPATGRHEPLYPLEERERLYLIREYLENTWVRNGWVRLSRGKEICVSIVPTSARWGDIVEVRDELAENLLSELGIDPASVNLTYSAGAVDITPLGVDKGAGVRVLLDRLDASAESAIAIGDGVNDLPMFRLCGLAAAPSNARPEVVRVVDYVAPAAETQGVLDVLRRFTGFDPGVPPQRL